MKKILTAGLSLAALAGKVAAADLPVKAPPQLPAYNWTGFYLGGHMGYAWGNSSWSTTLASGGFSLAEPIDVFSETGSFYEGLQAGYDYMLPSRYVIGVEGDVSFPSFPNLSGYPLAGPRRSLRQHSAPRVTAKRPSLLARSVVASVMRRETGYNQLLYVACQS